MHVDTLERFDWHLDWDCDSCGTSASEHPDRNARNDVRVWLCGADLRSRAVRELVFPGGCRRPSERRIFECLRGLALNRNCRGSTRDVCNICSCCHNSLFLPVIEMKVNIFFLRFKIAYGTACETLDYEIFLRKCLQKVEL